MDVNADELNRPGPIDRAREFRHECPLETRCRIFENRSSGRGMASRPPPPRAPQSPSASPASRYDNDIIPPPTHASHSISIPPPIISPPRDKTAAFAPSIRGSRPGVNSGLHSILDQSLPRDLGVTRTPSSWRFNRFFCRIIFWFTFIRIHSLRPPGYFTHSGDFLPQEQSDYGGLTRGIDASYS